MIKIFPRITHVPISRRKIDFLIDLNGRSLNTKSSLVPDGRARGEKTRSWGRQKNEYYIEEIKTVELLSSFTRHRESFR